jgi:hypothetical protein
LVVAHKYGKVGLVKTTIEIPDALFRQAKAAAALRAESLKDFVTAALWAHVESQEAQKPKELGWRSVFGMARPEEVAEVERIVAEELERVDPDAWR